MTLTEFLLARIAEDEEWARNPEFDWGDPERALAECEAKRRIVQDHARVGLPERLRSDESLTRYPDRCARCWDDGAYMAHPCRTLQSLAAVYADHADYDPEWRP